MPLRDRSADGTTVIGWDVGGAHLKACLRVNGQVHDILQLACPLWQGLDRLELALDAAAARSPAWRDALADGWTSHAVTMTGEMVDHFDDRADGVRRIAACLVRRYADGCGAVLRFYAGENRWYAPEEVGPAWREIASANWQASARHCAGVLGDAVWCDIGSTTTDLLVLRRGRPAGGHRSDAQRLASGELVYQGVVRTPLCALAPRIEFGGLSYNVMHEWFATTADVYRLTGELDPAHDVQPTADQAGKDAPATRRRLARMIGHEPGDASAEQWQAFAGTWRAAQLREIGENLRRVLDRHPLPPQAPLVAAGCGAFLVPELAAGCGRPWRDYGRDVAGLDMPQATGDALAAWARVCAPSVAVAALFEQDLIRAREAG